MVTTIDQLIRQCSKPSSVTIEEVEDEHWIYMQNRKDRFTLRENSQYIMEKISPSDILCQKENSISEFSEITARVNYTGL